MMTANPEILEREAAALTLLSTILRATPEKSWLDSLAIERVFDAVPYAHNQADALQGQVLLKTWMDEYGDESFDALYTDYMNLFIGPGNPLAPPWESTYAVDGECLVFQKETLEVRKWYRRFDLQIESLYREPDDHIAYELEFTARLSSLAAEALSGNDLSKAATLLEDQAVFLEDHLLNWAFKWTELVLANAGTDFYRGIAFLVQGVLTEINDERFGKASA